jgi:hypothetical protein
MKKIILFLSIFFSVAQSQVVVSETFSTYIPTQLDSTKGLWIFDSTYVGVNSTVINEDQSTNGNDLTLNGWSNAAEALDSCMTSDSPIISGGYGLKFNGVDNNLYILNASDGDFEFGTNDVTIEVLAYSFQANQDAGGMISDYGGSVPRWNIYMQSRDMRSQFRTASGDGFMQGNNQDNEWITYAFVFDRDVGAWQRLIGGSYIYSQINAESTEWTDLSAEDFVSPGNFQIGATSALGYWYESAIAAVRFTSRVLTEQELREGWMLPADWVSDGGNVLRTNWAFVQGFFDSEKIFTDIGGAHAIADADSTWEVTLDAYGGKAGDVLTAWVGSSTVARGLSATQTLTASSVSYTLELGSFNLAATDSIVFQASAADTVWIDNIVLQRGLSAAATSRDSLQTISNTQLRLNNNLNRLR